MRPKSQSHQTVRGPLHAFLFILVLAGCQAAPEATNEGHEDTQPVPEALPEVAGDTVLIPPLDPDEVTLEERAADQLATLDNFRVFHDFRFADRRPESGITFRNQIVDDLKRDLKPVHYDHGNSLSVADVDGDGRLDLYFTTQLGANELWRNLGDGRFEDWTAKAGVGLPDRISVAASFADIDNDGDSDLYVTTVRHGNALFENDSKGVFTNITESAGVAYEGHSSGAVFFDYDNDGRLDLFLANIGRYTTDAVGEGGYYVGVLDAFSGHLFPDRTEQSLLYRNLGGNRFAEVSEEAGLVDTSWSGDATAIDFDDDGDRDLYVTSMQGDDHYYRNDGGSFSRQSRQLFPRTPWGAMGLKSFDHDNDGRMDLLLTDMHSDMSLEIDYDAETQKSDMQWPESMLQTQGRSIFGNAFFHQQEDGSMREVSDALGLENYWPWGLSTGDLNADGWEDVFMASSMSYPYRYAVNSALLNNRGTGFMSSEFILGFEPRRDGATYIPWFDLDCGGKDAEHHHCRGMSGRITIHGTLGSRSSAIFDLDDDGDLDVVTNEFNYFPQVFISNLTDRRSVHYLKVALRGTVSNRDGLGAKVTVVSGESTTTKIHDGKSGYLAQSSLPLYFGLGDAEAVDSVEVRWPSGHTQTLGGDEVTVDALLEIIEPAL